MEYIISNKSFNNCAEFGGIYYSGPFVIENDKLSLLEGEIYPESDSIDIIKEYVKGGYNFIQYGKNNNELVIKNDKYGMLPLYIFSNNGKFIISNNFWLIIKNIDHGEIQIDSLKFKSYLYQIRIPEEGGTYFKNIKQLKAASKFSINTKSLESEETKYWELQHSQKKIQDVNEAVDLLDSDLSNFFKSVKNKYPDSVFGFGNSGGLDSRLIPEYAKEFDMPVVGYIIGDKKPRKLLNSTSHRSAIKIAKHYDFPHHNISYKAHNIKERYLIDIRNNPMGANQIFKNPFEKLPEFDILICGGNGFTISNENNQWKVFKSIEDLEQKIDFVYKYNSKYKFATTKEKYFKYIVKSKKNLKDNVFDSFISESERDQFREYIATFVKQNVHKDNLSLIRSFHQSIFNKQSPNGGFESVNRFRKTFYMYYPFALDNTLKWQDEFFFDRIVLKKLITKKSGTLASIPDQELDLIHRSQNKKIQFAKFLMRKRGLDYKEWYQDENIQSFIRETLERKNPIFEEIVLGDNLEAKEILNLHSAISLDFVKAKLILDIIYYKEYDFIDDNRFLIR